MSLNLLEKARQLGMDQSLPYAGALSPEDAYALLQENTEVVLVDVRTNAERDWVGRVTINDIQHHAVQWSLYPGAHQTLISLNNYRPQCRIKKVSLSFCAALACAPAMRRSWRPKTATLLVSIFCKVLKVTKIITATAKR